MGATALFLRFSCLTMKEGMLELVQEQVFVEIKSVGQARMSEQ
jgi:hypothetical protein